MPPTSAQYQSLTRRKGSASAHDPFALRTDDNVLGDRQTTSRLTIVRVGTDDAETLYDSAASSPHGSPKTSPLLHSRSLPRRAGSPRLSFASSSFTQDGAPSPPRSPVLRRNSFTSAFPTRVSLTPQQVCDLAKTSKHPQQTDIVRRQAQRGRGARDDTPNFISVPQNQFLPFLDRPSEVAAFISTSPTNRLLTLLEQAFPVESRLHRPPRDSSQPPPYTPSSSDPSSFASQLTQALADRAPAGSRPAFDDPAAWSYATLLEWMCTVSRADVEDAEWVRRLRTCIMAHSEQICVTLCSALGVPMEGIDQPPAAPTEHIHAPTPEHAALADVRSSSTRVVTTPPTLLDDPAHEDADAFHLNIAPILSTVTYDAVHPRTPSSHSSSRPSSRLSSAMDSIGETDSESDPESEHKPEPTPAQSGTATARAGSPVGRGAAHARRTDAALQVFAEPSSASASEDDEFGDALALSDLYGLTLATSLRAADDPALPSPRPTSALPFPVTSSKPPKRREAVAHVLSGAPGHAGYTWRPGGPLFARSFSGDQSSEDEDKPAPLPE
ncbi:hypothetical protein OF83DRAFT_1083420 [Amylostereum chailletii]|nr:hypothetical protein OF83DRAFT_1083420 [Amylostereum chailletii]